jgi:hypothetical protein
MGIARKKMVRLTRRQYRQLEDFITAHEEDIKAGRIAKSRIAQMAMIALPELPRDTNRSHVGTAAEAVSVDFPPEKKPNKPKPAKNSTDGDGLDILAKQVAAILSVCEIRHLPEFTDRFCRMNTASLFDEQDD